MSYNIDLMEKLLIFVIFYKGHFPAPNSFSISNNLFLCCICKSLRNLLCSFFLLRSISFLTMSSLTSNPNFPTCQLCIFLSILLQIFIPERHPNLRKLYWRCEIKNSKLYTMAQLLIRLTVLKNKTFPFRQHFLALFQRATVIANYSEIYCSILLQHEADQLSLRCGPGQTC